MKTSVVIPNFNGEELLKENLPSVIALGADEIIVVDDASSDNSIDFLKTQEVRVIKNEKNLGFAKSVNKGVKVARGDAVILLNTDVKPKAGLLKAIQPHFKDVKVFGVSFAEEKFSYSRGFWKDGFVEHEPGVKTDKPHLSFWVSGGSGAFRKSIWDNLGGLDSIYAPFYWEDVDICYRAAKRGYKLLWEPKATVEHGHEGTIGKYYSRSYIDFIQERNQLIFIWKNITNKKMFKEHIVGLVKRILNGPGYIRIVVSTLSKLDQIKNSRAIEKKESIITDEKIFSEFK